MDPIEINSMPDTQRQSGLELTGEVPWGTNICHFYHTNNELTAVTLPFLKAGLENNEYCIWSLPEHIDGLEAIRILKDYLSDFDHHIYNGSLEILAYDNRSQRPEEAVSGILDRMHSALRNGFAGLRMVWSKGGDGIKGTLLEQRINNVVGVQRILNLCNYHAADMDLNRVLHSAAHYDYSFTSKEGKLELFRVADAAVEVEQDMAISWEELLKRNSELEWFTYMVAHHLLSPLNDSIDVVRQFNNYAGNNPEVEPALLGSVKKLEQMLEELEIVLRIANDIHQQKQ